MITIRDQDILNFIDKFHIATTNQIKTLFFPNVSYRYCAKRLKDLLTWGYIKQIRSTINNCNAYFIEKRPAQIHHDLIRAEVYTYLSQRHKILEWHNEYPIKNIRPDALCYVDKGNAIIVEIHLSNRFNFEKYDNMDLYTLFGCNPRIIICSDREVRLNPKQAIKFESYPLNKILGKTK